MAAIRADAYGAWLREQAAQRRPCWYGCCHYLCTGELPAEKRRQYPAQYADARLPRFEQDILAGQICADCTGGAIKGAAWTLPGTQKHVCGRLGCPDLGADAMFAFCKNSGAAWGSMDSASPSYAPLPPGPGIAPHKPGHVGVTAGDGRAVEWISFDTGCVLTTLSARPWQHWYRLPWVEYPL